jgi:hypothetical protein
LPPLVDGAPLTPRGSGIDQLQYLPAEPFAPGPHELVVRAVRDGSYNLPPQTNESRLSFTVASDLAVGGAVNVDSVRFYPAYDGDQKIDNPPVGREVEDCASQAVPLTPGCDDSRVFGGYPRIGYRAEGNPIVYVTGDTLFPSRCTTVGSEAIEPTDPGDFSVTTVLATGLDASRGYDADIEIQNAEGSERVPSACSLGSGAPAESLVAPAGVLLGALADAPPPRALPGKVVPPGPRRPHGDAGSWHETCGGHHVGRKCQSVPTHVVCDRRRRRPRG